LRCCLALRRVHAHVERRVATKAEAPRVLIELRRRDTNIEQHAVNALLDCAARSPQCVRQIAEALDLSQSLVSHHLRLLRGARLVRGERQAKHIFYSIADQHVSQVLQDMAVHISEDKADD